MLPENNINDILIQKELTILNGQTTSPVFDTKGGSLITIMTPSALDGANISFQIGDNENNFLNYFNTLGTLVSIPVLADQAIGIVQIDFKPVQLFKIVSDATETADRIFKIFITAV